MGLFDRFKKKDAPAAASPEVDALIALLAERDPQARAEACRALAKLGARAQKAAPALHTLIDDDDGDVCNAAASALSDIERNPA